MKKLLDLKKSIVREIELENELVNKIDNLIEENKSYFINTLTLNQLCMLEGCYKVKRFKLKYIKSLRLKLELLNKRGIK